MITERLPYLSYKEATEFYAEFVPQLKPTELALLGCNDRYFLLTGLLNRPDMMHPWRYDRCREVEAGADGYLDLWFREAGKSSIITFAGAIQEILCDPEITIGIFSNTKAISQPFLSQIKQELESNEELQKLYPDVLWEKPSKEAPSWSVDGGITVKRKSNPKEASIEAHGLIDAMPTGRHFGLQIFNDVITEKNVTNPEQIKKSAERFELADNLGKSEGSRKWYEGTRYCTIGSMRILMADWSHKPISEVQIGEEVVGWEIRDGGRYLRPAKVLNRGVHLQQPVQRFTLTNGQSVTCTEDHKWWRGAHGGGPQFAPLGLPTIKRPDRPPKGKKCDGKLVALRQLLVPVEKDEGRDAGYVAGFFDGEGTMNLNTGKNRASGRACLTQSMANPELVEEVRDVLVRLGFRWSESWWAAAGRPPMRYDRCVFSITGGWRERYRFLAQIGPVKREKLAQSLFAKLCTERVKLAKSEDAGLADVHWLETETGNYIVEGFCSSNSYADHYGAMIENGVAIPRIYPATDDGTLDGKPVLLSQEAWDRKKKAQRSQISAQMLQNPLAGNENTFRVQWLKPYFVRPAMLNVYIMGDPSRGKSKTSDRTALAVVGSDVGGNKYLLDGFCHRMPLSERWRRLEELHKKWSNVPGVQLVKVGYERYGMQSDEEYFDEKMGENGVRFDIEELSWTGEVGRQAKTHRVERLEPDFREGSFFVPFKVWHPGITDGEGRTHHEVRWFLQDEDDEIHYRPNPGLHAEERRCKANGEHWRVFDPIKRLDEDRKIYDVTRVLFEEYRFFPFSPRDDLIDAVSRIYDMEPMAAVRHETVHIEDFVDS